MTTTEQLYKIYQQHPVISTDTRKIAERCLFFALKGDKFDANTFAGEALNLGAAYAVIDNPDYQINEKCLLVTDVLTALQDLARHHRKQLNIPVIGLTGSNGKTTTKELIYSVLSQRFKTLATQGNLNNHIGVPLTILTIDGSHQMAVIEMGANHQKEIAFLCTIAQPTHGLITNVGKAHLEGFGGVEGVKKGKGELYDYLSERGTEVRKSGSTEDRKLESTEVGKAASPQDNNALLSDFRTSGLPDYKKTVFVNSNSTALMDMQAARHFETPPIFYGDDKNSLVGAQLTENSPLLALRWTNHQTGENYTVKTQLTGAYNLDNILAAICIGVYFKLAPAEINKGIEGYQPKNNRSQIVQTATNTLICDYYNANPSSMFVAIENLGKLKAQRKVMILGDMFELGEESLAEHGLVIKKALDMPVDESIFIGKYFQQSAAGRIDDLASVGTNTFYSTAEEAMEALKSNPIRHSTVLIKGSRGMALERLAGLF